MSGDGIDPSNILNMERGDLKEEDVQTLEKLKADLEKAYLSTFTKTHQGVSKKDVPLPQIVMGPKVTQSTSNTLPIEIEQNIATTVDKAVSATLANKLDSIIEDMIQTKLASPMANFNAFASQFRGESSAAMPHIFSTTDGSKGQNPVDPVGPTDPVTGQTGPT